VACALREQGSAVDDATARRWSAAADLVTGVDDAQLARRRTRAIVLAVVLAVVPIAFGVTLGSVLLSFGSGSASSGEVMGGSLLAQFTLLGLGFAVDITGMVWAVRHGYFVTRWRIGSSALNGKEKRLVRRQIAGRAPVDDHLGIVVGIAKQTRRACLGVAPIYAALVLFAASIAVSATLDLVRYLQLVAMLLFLVVVTQLVVTFKRADRFIKRHDTTPATALG